MLRLRTAALAIPMLLLASPAPAEEPAQAQEQPQAQEHPQEEEEEEQQEGEEAQDRRTLEEIQDCVARNHEHDASVSTIVLRSQDRFDQVTESRAKLHRRKFEDGLSKVHLRFSDPLDLRGSALLLIEKEEGANDMFMYLPELGRSRRVTGHMVSGSMFGTDFSYEQFQRLQGMARDASVRRLDDSEWKGRKVHVLEHHPGPESGSAFRKVVSHVDARTCVPVRTEYYEHGEDARKVLHVDVETLEERDGRWIPRRLVMRDLRDESRTVLSLEDVRLDAEIPYRVFSQAFLERGH